MNNTLTQESPVVQDMMKSSTVITTVPVQDNAGKLLPMNKRDEIMRQAQSTDLNKESLRDISMVGSDADIGLNKALSGFLDRINRADSPRLFNLVSSFNDTVSKEDIPKLAEKVLDEKLPLKNRIIGFFTGKKLSTLKNDFLESTRQVISAKSSTLTTVIVKMENELAEEQKRLEDELKNMEKLQVVYFQQYQNFVERTYFAQCLLENAKAADTSAWDQSALRTWSEKLQALESRALAMEGVMTRLPADALIVSQLQNAGVMTLQETTTTAAGRFASIKMTLITLNSALVTRSVQQLAEQSASLDSNLMEVRSKLMKQVVGTAASAPGRNRLQQAEQLKSIIADTKDLMKIVDDAKALNTQQFAQARIIFGESLKEITSLGAQVNISKLDK